MKRAFCAGVVLLIACSAGWADLAGEFSGYETVWEIGVSGLTSTNGATEIPTSMFTLGPGRVDYLSGVGEEPSPGVPGLGQIFDEGVLGVKFEGGNLIVQIAGGLNPETGYFHSGFQAYYGQGDMFITVEDSSGIGNFALLNSWARNTSGGFQSLGKSTETHYDDAMDFHNGLEGHLVDLNANDAAVALSGGAGTYNPSNPRAGLDYRVYAEQGDSVGDASIEHSSVYDGQDWYIQKWTVPVEWLSSDTVFTIGLHKAASCLNDQISMVSVITTPVPAAALLGVLGLGVAGLKLRRRS